MIMKKNIIIHSGNVALDSRIILYRDGNFEIAGIRTGNIDKYTKIIRNLRLPKWIQSAISNKKAVEITSIDKTAENFYTTKGRVLELDKVLISEHNSKKYMLIIDDKQIQFNEINMEEAFPFLQEKNAYVHISISKTKIFSHQLNGEELFQTDEKEFIEDDKKYNPSDFDFVNSYIDMKSKIKEEKKIIESYLKRTIHYNIYYNESSKYIEVHYDKINLISYDTLVVDIQKECYKIKNMIQEFTETRDAKLIKSEIAVAVSSHPETREQWVSPRTYTITRGRERGGTYTVPEHKEKIMGILVEYSDGDSCFLENKKQKVESEYSKNLDANKYPEKISL